LDEAFDAVGDGVLAVEGAVAVLVRHLADDERNQGQVLDDHFFAAASHLVLRLGRKAWGRKKGCGGLLDPAVLLQEERLASLPLLGKWWGQPVARLANSQPQNPKRFCSCSITTGLSPRDTERIKRLSDWH